MKFYDILQWDPQVTKNLIRKSEDSKERLKLWFGMFSRSVLIVVFAIVFIASLSKMFGDENSPMAVAIFCILLGVRFVDFGYCIKDALLNLTVVFLLLLFSPVLAYKAFPLIGLVIHFVSFFVILYLTSDKPELGNGGLFSFAYIYLSGNPVYGEALFRRVLLTVVGLAICGMIFYIKHKQKFQEVRFTHKVKEFSLYNHKHQWMIRMSLGVALMLTIGTFFKMERFMWAGFACGSLLCDHTENPKIKERFFHRLIGALAGCGLFYIINALIPEEFQFIIGPMGGFILGFCTDYRYKTAANCLGALMLATGLYGVHTAILLRIVNTMIGIVFALIFYHTYNYLILRKFKSK